MVPSARSPRAPGGALLLPCLLALLLLTPALAPPPAPADGGYGQLLEDSARLVRQALRDKDWDAAERAWLAVLEVEPLSLEALEGLVEVAVKRGEPDAELRARRDYGRELARRVAGGERKLERTLRSNRERQLELDPRAGAAEPILQAYSDEQRELALAYEGDGMWANALVAWLARYDSSEPTDEAAAEALAGMARAVEQGDDWVGQLGLTPDLSAGDKDAAWIAAFDAKSKRFNRAGEWETPHYRFRVAGNWRLGQAAAQAMEQAHAFYRDIWGILPDPPPEHPPEGLRDITITPIAVDIYATHEEYIKRTGSPEWSGGVFQGSVVATYDHGDSGSSWRATLPTLFHEASHQFMREAVGNPPSFVNEGVACLFETIEVLPNGTIRRDLPSKSRLQDLAQRIRLENDFSLRKVMDPKEGNQPEFYSPRWGLFYFLRMYVDEQGGYPFREVLDDYIYSFKRGTPGDTIEHFEEHVLAVAEVPGLERFDQFEAVWRQWILDLEASGKSQDSRLDDFRRKARLAGLKKEWRTALAFQERVLDIEPDDLDALKGLVDACDALGDADRAVFHARRLSTMVDPEHPWRRELAEVQQRLDPHHRDWRDTRTSLVGGMAGLALQYDRDGLPLMAMAVAQDVLDVDPDDPSAQALVRRLERETGRSAVRWRRLYNGVDLDGWYGASEGGAFFAGDGAIVADYSRVDPTGALEAGASLYQTMFLEQAVQGDWSMEVRLHCREDWEIAGLCFGAEDSEEFEAIVLRNRHGDAEARAGINNVDFGSFDGAWTYRGDGSYKASFDPTGPDGTLLRVDVRRGQVAVTVDGVPVKPVVDGKTEDAIRYPRGALRGDAGLLASKGVTRFSDLRLLAGRTR